MMIKFKESNYIKEDLNILENALLNDMDYISTVKEKLSTDYGEHIFLCANASLALDMLFLAYDFKKGSEVIIPSYTYPSALNTILRFGCVPVLCDIDETTCVIDVEHAKALKTDKTVCIIPTHYGGVSCDMDQLKEEFSDIKIIEDAALSFGASYKGKALGSLADASVLSFHRTKNISCEEGGAIVLNDVSIIDKVHLIFDNGTNREAFIKHEVKSYSWQKIGFNAKMNNLSAALLSTQLDKLETITHKQRSLFDTYYKALKPIESKGFKCPTIPVYNQNNYHIFYLVFKNEELKNKVQDHLNAQGIEAVIHYVPLHQNLDVQSLDYPNTNHVANCLLRLPMHTKMSKEDCLFIVQEIELCL